MSSSKIGITEGAAQHEWHALPVSSVLKILHTGAGGLSAGEVEMRRKRYGMNAFTQKERESALLRVFAQFKSPLTLVLFLAFVATAVLGDYLDASVILVALLIAVALGVFQEGKASRAFEKLSDSQVRYATVIRGGKKHQVEAYELVSGDIVFIQGGMQVPADIRIIESKQLQVSEAALTGEWLPTDKGAKRVAVGTPFAERSSIAHLGSFVSKGYGTGVVVATGNKTAVGTLAGDLEAIEEEQTPIQWEMARISRVMVIIILILITVIFAVGMFRGGSLEVMLITAIAIAVASIPEGLPAAVTIILAVGMESLLRRGGLVRNLLAAETLGSTTYILTDKTGTLTQARMAITEVVSIHTAAKKNKEHDWGDSIEVVKDLFDIALCASNGYLDEAQNEEEKYIVRGEPIERAIVEAAQDTGITLTGDSLRGRRVDFLAFESENRFAAGLTAVDSTHLLCLNGAPELLLERSVSVSNADGTEKLTDKQRSYFAQEIDTHTSNGKRLIAVGFKEVSFSGIPEDIDGLLDNMVFAGLLVFDDPVRDDVAEAIAGVMRAGASVRLVTGDNPATALSVARAVGIARKHDVALTGDQLAALNDTELLEVLKTTRVFARVLPKQKLRLAQVLQSKGEIVAMTGDGINDALVLRKANIGIALGSGTEVAKESSDLVLVNDSFSTIHAAIEEGRRIMGNLQRIVGYLLATSLTEAVLIAAALLTGAALPLLPTQILWANIIEEGLMSVAFAFEPVDKNAMREKPKDIIHEEGVVSREMLLFLIFVLSVFGILLVSFYEFLRIHGVSIEELRSVMFIAISVDSLFIAFSFKSLFTPLWQIPVRNNLFFIVSFFFSILLLLVVIWVPFLQHVFSYVPLSVPEFAFVFLYGLLSLMTIEAGKWAFFRKRL
jgi:Ca2+-transporting ATPase